MLKRVAAIDFGTVRVGVAVSDELGLMAHPRPILNGKMETKLIQELVTLAKEENIGRFLVGLPLHMGGQSSRISKKVIAFSQKLANQTELEIEFVDERMSSKDAARQMLASGRDKGDPVDSVAAAILLQSWLDGKRED